MIADALTAARQPLAIKGPSVAAGERLVTIRTRFRLVLVKLEPDVAGCRRVDKLKAISALPLRPFEQRSPKLLRPLAEACAEVREEPPDSVASPVTQRLSTIAYYLEWPLAPRPSQQTSAPSK